MYSSCLGAWQACTWISSCIEESCCDLNEAALGSQVQRGSSTWISQGCGTVPFQQEANHLEVAMLDGEAEGRPGATTKSEAGVRVEAIVKEAAQSHRVPGPERHQGC